MRIIKLTIFFLFLLFSQFSYSADFYTYNNGNQAVSDCRSAIDATNHYYCTLTFSIPYIQDNNHHIFVLGYLQLKNSSGSVINNYYFGTDMNNVNNINSCASVPDLSFNSTFYYNHCQGDPSALRICPSGTSWMYNTTLHQCVFAGTDTDNDGVPNDGDNCPLVANQDQANSDSDTFGNACDNCPTATNQDQLDSDSDGIGDACENTTPSDTDGDGVNDFSDNCPNIPNPDQANADNDTFGDVCDSTPNGPDDDGDGIPNISDNCPSAPNPSQSDIDGDSIGDACDTCSVGDYTNHQEFASDSVSSSIPASYCGSNLCMMVKSTQSCSSGVCFVDYASNGASCSPDSTPSNWQQYFLGSAQSQGFNLAADNANFTIISGLSNLMGTNQNQKFIVTNCSRSSDTGGSGWIWHNNSSGCAGLSVLNVCSTPVEIDASVQAYVRANPFQSVVDSMNGYDTYVVSYDNVVLGGSSSGSTFTPDYNLGTDNGTGTYTASVKSTNNYKYWFSDTGYSSSVGPVTYPLKLALKGCTSVDSGGTGDTGGTGGGPSGTYQFNSGGVASGFGTEATDALVTAQTELTDTLNTIKSEFNTFLYGSCGTDSNGYPVFDELGNPVSCSFGLNSGTAELPIFELGIVKGVDVTVDWTKWSDPLLSVGNAIVVLAALLAFSIIF